MDFQLNNIKFQLNNINSQFENLFMQIQNNGFQNIGMQIYNMGIQALNIGMQIINLGIQIPSIGMIDSFNIKNQIQNIGMKIQNLGNQMNNMNNIGIQMNNMAMPIINMNMNNNYDFMKGFNNEINNNNLNHKVEKYHPVFKFLSGKSLSLNLDENITVDEMIKILLNRIGKTDNKDIKIVYNCSKLELGDKTAIKKLFLNDSPIIMVFD